MALQPVASGDTPTANTDTPAPVESTFHERKMAALQAEADPTPGTPDQYDRSRSAADAYAESAKDDDPYDGPSDPYHPDEGTPSDSEEVAGEEQDTDAEGALFDDQSEDTPDAQPDDTDTDAPDDYAKLQDRYDNLVRKFNEVTENRTAIENDLTATAERNVALSHEFDDHSRAAIARAKLFLDLANNQVGQFETMNWDAVEPERIAEVKQRYTEAKHFRDQLVAAFGEAEEADKTAREAIKEREAQHSRSILPIKISGWSNELYTQLRDFAVNRYGYTAAEFNDITDYRPILMAHDALVASQAAEKVTKVKREQRARRPRNRNARPQPRNAEGRFQSAKDKAFAERGNKAAFREYKERQLEREQGQRR